MSVEEVLDETFVGYRPDVQSDWSAFHSLDTHRGGPPLHTTADSVLTSLQMLGAMVSPRGITTVPMCDALVAEQVLRQVSVIPLIDAAPSVLSLVWRADNRHPLLDALAAAAERVTSVNGAAGAAAGSAEADE